MSHFALIILAALAAGADETAVSTPAVVPLVDPRAVEVQLADESVLKLLLADERIKVVTPHGTLFVPADEIRRIEFAQRLPDETVRRVVELIDLLRNADSEVHEPAAAELLALQDNAYLALTKAAKGGDPQLAPRAGEVLKRLREKLGKRELSLRDDDLIETTDTKIAGRIDMPSLKIQTAQFGELALKLADARSLRHQSLITRAPEKEPENVLPDPGNLLAYQAQLNQTFGFRVTGALGGVVWGTDIYTTDSQLSTAAVHAGILKPGETGVVRLKILPSPAAFAGSTRHGVTTQNFGRYGGAYQILKAGNDE